jgi:uncharacterized membrane protein
LRNNLYEALVAEGLMDKSPEKTRGRYLGCGTVMLVGSGASIFLAFAITEASTPAMLCIPAAGVITGIVALFTGRAMPRKTQKGSTAAARWGAFKRYLEELEQHADLNEAATNFEAYLPYAVAFGLERTWIDKFRQVPTMAPPIWYLPRPHTGRRGVLGGGSSQGGSVPSLDSMNTSLSGGLDSMSRGFTRMLDNTAKTMRSAPSSSSSGGGGGGFSGGFSGGSSGGGSSGFR